MLFGKNMKLVFVIVLSGLLIAGMVFLYLPYRRDIKAAYQKLEKKKSITMNSPYGLIEYGSRGEGDPVLLIHGASGGFDQGVDLAAQHVGEGYEVIAPSRFGYLGTSLPENATVEMQTDALVYLLDGLGIDQVVVMTYSAGGSSAAQMALRYPGRVSGLILISTAIADKPLALPPKPIIRGIVRSDFIFWVLSKPLRPLAQRMFVPADLQLTSNQKAEVEKAMGDLLPVHPRSQGLVFDMFVTNTDPHLNKEAYPLEQIEAPTLIINARDDPAANYQDAKRMSERIPNATFVSVESGGHLMLGNGNTVAESINSFLAEHSP